MYVAFLIIHVFGRYDPRVLERVQRDEDFAAAAARASGGRPTYCDNRYYRAVANGGQGTSNSFYRRIVSGGRV